MRRDVFLTREIRLEGGGEAIASCTQEWAHVAAVSTTMEVARAPRSLISAFAPDAGPEGDIAPSLPKCERAAIGGPQRYPIRAWWTWMDPLDHLNHPAYVDYIDESLSVAMHEYGIAPLRLVPVAEQLTFRSGVLGGEIAIVESVPRGWTADGSAVFSHQIKVGERLCVTGTSVRRIMGETGECSLIAALGGRVADS